MGHRESGDVVVGVQAEDPLLLFLTHIREMKRQEARLRIATLLLLLGCAALVVFSCADFTHRRAAMAAVSSPDPSIQNRLNPAGHPSSTSPPDAGTNAARLSTPSPLHIHLTSTHEIEKIVQWHPSFGDEGGAYNSTDGAVVIPAEGHYFVYMRFELFPCDQMADGNQRADGDPNFVVKLLQKIEGYSDVQTPMNIIETVRCEQPRSIYVGQLLHLDKGDRLTVLLQTGYGLIVRSFFGAFRT